MSNKFQHYLGFPELPDSVIQEALAAEYTITPFPPGSGNTSRRTWKSRATEFEKTKFFKDFRSQFRAEAFYLRNPPHSLYDWHVDGKRLCAVNWVITTNPGAHTFFRSVCDPEHLKYANRMADKLRVLNWRLEEVDYTLSKPTLLNTTQEHMVINNHSDQRIILTLSSLTGSFDSVKEYLDSISHVDWSE